MCQTGVNAKVQIVRTLFRFFQQRATIAHMLATHSISIIVSINTMFETRLCAVGRFWVTHIIVR